jgi:hypothetical protein
VTQVGRRLAYAPPCTLETGGESEPHVSFQHVRAGPGQLMRSAREGRARAGFFLPAGQLFWAHRMVAEEQHRRFGEGPLELRMPALRAGGALPLPRRFLGTRAQAAVGHTILDPREPADIMTLVEPHQAQKLADAGNRLKPGEGLGVMRLGCLHDGQVDIATSLVREVNQGAVDFPTFVHGRIGKPCSTPVAVRVVGDRLAKLRQVVRPVGLLHVGQAFRAFPRQRQAAPEQGPGRAHGSRLDIGLGPHAPAAPHGQLLGVDRVVVGLAPIARFHGERLSQDQGKALGGAEVGEPRPREEAFDADDEVFAVGCKRLQKRFGPCLPMPVAQALSRLVQDAKGHGPGVQVEATIKLVVRGVASHGVSSAAKGRLLTASSPTGVCRGGGLNKYQARAGDALQRPLPLACAAEAQS